MNAECILTETLTLEICPRECSFVWVSRRRPCPEQGNERRQKVRDERIQERLETKKQVPAKTLR